MPKANCDENIKTRTPPSRLDWKTDKELAELYPLTQSWLQKLRRPGADGPPYYRKNPAHARSPVVYRIQDFEAWWHKNRVDPSKE